MRIAPMISTRDQRTDHLKTPRDQPEKEQTRAVLQSINPFSGEVLKTYAEMGADEVEEAIARAHEEFATWKRTSFSERAGFLRRAAALCRERTEQLAKLMTLEMVKRIVEARKETKLCAAIFEYYAR